MTKRSTAIIALYTTNGEILLEDRRNHSRYGEEWGFFGGGMQFGETPQKALKREIKEELTYNLEEFTFLKTYFGKMQEIVTTEHLFVAHFPGWDHISIKKNQGASLFSIQDMRELQLMKTHYGMIDDIAKKISTKK